MASRGQSLTVTYVAWDTSANAGKTGDVLNHTLRWVKDGTSAAPTNAASEVDATNAPGLYKLTLTGTECTCDFGVLAGKSSTANVSVMPVSVSFELLPTALGANGNVKADVLDFNGTAGTFSSGRPEVNTSHWGGTAVASAVVSANAVQISGDSVAADNAESFFDGTGYAGTNNVIPTVTAVTTVNGLAADTVTASALAADAVTEIQAGLSTLDAAAVNAEVDTALADYDAPTYTELLNLVRLMARKDAAVATDLAALLTSINADLTSGPGTFDNTTDALEAQRDNHPANFSALTISSGRVDVGLWLGSAPNALQSGRVDAYLGAAAAGVLATGAFAASYYASVNAEVVDALATDTYAEPGAAPAATASLAAKIGWMQALSRNKLTQTDTTQTLRNDADSGSVATSTISDDGTTFTRAKWV